MTRPALYLPTVLCLVALASVAFLGKSYETSLRGIDSNIHAAVSMSVTSGPGLKPVLPIPIKNFAAAAPARPDSKIDPNRVFNDHPFFLFWVNGLVMRALGAEAWSARLLTGLFSVGTVLLTLAIGTTLAGRAFGALAAMLIIFCRDFILTSATVSLDTALVFFIVLTFYLWIKNRWLWLGIAAGIGLWVKTPLVLLVFPTALVHDTLRKDGPRRRLIRKTGRGLVGAGLLAVAVGSLVWIYTGLAGGWELVEDYWVRQLWGTAVGGRGQGSGWDWGQSFFYNLRTGFLPGLPFLPIALFQVWRRKLWRKPSFTIPAAAVGVIAVVVTSLKFKMGHYYTPMFPFLALISAHSAADWLQKRENGFYSSLACVTPVFLAFLLVVPVSFGPTAFVALKRFVPFIQTHGGCEDVIALVPGGEPVGSSLDYSLFLNFYTGRTAQVVECSELSARVESVAPPAWVILSDENRKGCLSASAAKRYPTALLVGTQYLLSTRIESSPIMDLTPLELEQKAVTDCRAPKLPEDRWHHYLKTYGD